MNIYSASNHSSFPFGSLFPDAKYIVVDEDFTDFEPPGFLILWGGSDVHPMLYNRQLHKRSHCSIAPSEMDRRDIKTFINAFNCYLPIVGICRGAQICCVMNGGILIQDVTGHYQDHAIVDAETGERLVVNSSHHQMMYPWETKHELVAYTVPPRSNCYDGITDEELAKVPSVEYEGLDKPIMIEPEVVWFPETKSLGVQFHPEYSTAGGTTNKYFKDLIERFVIKTETQ